MNIVALDLSTAKSGWAVSNQDGIEVGLVISDVERKRKKTDPTATLEERASRMDKAIEVILAATMGTYLPDLLIIEAPSYQGSSGTWDRAGFWWRVVQEFREVSVPIALCPGPNRAKFATGSGGAGKDEVLSAVIRRYPDVMVTDNNMADAMAMLGAALTKLGLPTPAVPLTHSAALTGIAWPEGM